MAVLLHNKKALFDYEILEEFEAGLELKGFEVKSLKNGRGSLAGSRVIIRENEAYIIGLDIPPYQPKNIPADYNPQRTRRLLLRKKEISYLQGKSQQAGLTLVPINVYTKGKLAKLAFGVARGLKKYDKRERIKEREARRRMEKVLKAAGAY